MLTFEEYCKSKKINPELFLGSEAEKYGYLKNYFEQVHPDSFTSQKLFLINELRRTYLYTEPKVVESIIENEAQNNVEEPKIAEIAKPKIGLPKIPKPSSEASSAPKPIVKPKIPVKSDASEETEKEVKPVLARPKIPAMKPKIPSTPVEKENSSGTEEKKTLLAKPKIPSLKPKTEMEKEDNSEENPKAAVLKPKIPSPKRTENPEGKEEPKKAPALRPKIPPKKD